MSDIPASVRRAVAERAGNLCELGQDCRYLFGDFGSWMVMHHKQAKGMGGSKHLDTPDNIIQIHDECHRYVHAHVPWSEEHGYIVSRFTPTQPRT